MTLSNIVALFGTLLILAVTPGPSDFAVIARSMTSGFFHGVLMVAGIVVADILFIVVAVYGLAEMATSMGNLFILVKYVCGAYLIWLGIGSLKPRLKMRTLPNTRGTIYSSFFSGFLITIGEPKALLFYLGLFPAFVDLSNVSVADTISIMLVATIVVGGVKGSYAYLASQAKRLLENYSIRRKLDLASGWVLISTGVLLVLAQE